MMVSVAGLLCAVVSGEESLCSRLSTSLSAKAGLLAEACEAALPECPSLAADYHLRFDAHRTLCSVSTHGSFQGVWT